MTSGEPVDSGQPSKPLPEVTPLERPFWESARRHSLSIQRCAACGTFRYPASPICTACDSDAYRFEPVSGRGRVLSFVVFHRCYFPSFAREVPYNVAIVALDEGVNVVSTILAPNEALRRDLPVEVVFEDVSPEIAIPKFRPVEAPATA